MPFLHIFRKSSISLVFIFFVIPATAQQSKNLHHKVQQYTDIIFDSLVEVRRDLHRFPEVSGEEEKTSAKVADYLKNLGLEVYTILEDTAWWVSCRGINRGNRSRGGQIWMQCLQKNLMLWILLQKLRV
jgi:hypothetical protein